MALAGADHQASVRLRGGGEEVDERDPERRRDLLHGADRRRHLAVLELRDEAGGEARLRGEAAQAQAALRPQQADLLAHGLLLEACRHPGSERV